MKKKKQNSGKIFVGPDGKKTATRKQFDKMSPAMQALYNEVEKK